MAILEEPDDFKISFVWNNLTVTVADEESFLRIVWRKLGRNRIEQPLTILNGVSGCAVTGNLIAIMGPSGAGKTTFLATLAGRIMPTTGSVSINGQTVSRETMFKLSSYLPQFDALPNSLTVEEHLLFSVFSYFIVIGGNGTYALKTGLAGTQRKFLLLKLLTELGLIDCKDVLISKLSGGQRKRVSLASETITRPKILFIDEPTTGLDAFSAMQVVQTLKIVSQESIVFCTIHQPGMDIYSVFTHTLLLSDGKMGYFGTLEDATKFFSSLGFECPVGFDESEYYIKLLSPKRLETFTSNPMDIGSTEFIHEICLAFSRSPPPETPQIVNSRDLEVQTQRKAGSFAQFSWLTWRIWTQNRRTMFEDWISWISYFLSMAAVAIFYTGINPTTQQGVQNARGALYMMSSEISFTVAYSVIYEFPGQLLIYLREDDVYATGPYYAAMFFGLIPKATLKAMIFTTVMYFILVTQIDFLNFLLYCLTTSVAAICGTVYGLMFSSWVDDIDILTSIMVPIDMLFLLTAGMFYNLRSLPSCLTYLKYFSIFFYLNEALSIIYWSRVNNIDCQTSSDLPCLRNGEQVLSEYGFRQTNFVWDLTGLVVLTVAMSLAGYIGLRRRRRIRMLL